MKPITVTATLTANEPYLIHVAGNYVHCLTALGDIQVRLGGEAPLTLSRGIGVPDPTGFERLEITSPVNQTVKLILSQGPVGDGRGSTEAEITFGATGATQLEQAMRNALGDEAISTLNESEVANAFETALAPVKTGGGTGLRLDITTLRNGVDLANRDTIVHAAYVSGFISLMTALLQDVGFRDELKAIFTEADLATNA